MVRPATQRLPGLPPLLNQKLTKTGYTRGASVREIYQNRVTRNNPVLIPLEFWDQCRIPDDGSSGYENGLIVLVEPDWYFTELNPDAQLRAEGLEIGVNALLLFRRRADWVKYAPDGALPNGKSFTAATSRTAPLGGVYFARVHATVADGGHELVEGFDTTQMRGAGIRVYEYASSEIVAHAKLQLEVLVWLCCDATPAMVRAGMAPEDVERRRDSQLGRAMDAGLLDYERLTTLRMIDEDRSTICPLCKRRIAAGDLLRRTTQAEGREVFDLTTTEISLFHIQELRVGRLQHKPYNLGWGHHYCNVVVKDAGIIPTLKWMQGVLDNQSPEHPLSVEAALVEEAVDG